MNTEQYTKITKIAVEMLENAHHNHSYILHEKELTEIGRNREAEEHKDDLFGCWPAGDEFEKAIQRYKNDAEKAMNKLLSIRKITNYLIDNFIRISDDSFVPEIFKDEFDVVLGELNKRTKDAYFDMYNEEIELAKIVGESEVNKKYGGHGKDGLINLKSEHLNARKKEHEDFIELIDFWKNSFKVKNGQPEGMDNKTNQSN